MVKYKLLDKQKEFIEIPHSESLDVAIYQGGYGSGKNLVRFAFRNFIS